MRKVRWSLYRKVMTLVILLGIVPLTLVSTLLMSRLVGQYIASLKETFALGVRNEAASVEGLFDGYNELSKFSYYFNNAGSGGVSLGYQNYDHLRTVLTLEAYAGESDEDASAARNEDMAIFLRNLLRISSGIEAVHFEYRQEDGTYLGWHAWNYQNAFISEEDFQEAVGLHSLDTSARTLLIIPPHSFRYTSQARTGDQVISVARNYFDLTGTVGHEKYIGTLLIDIAPETLAQRLDGLTEGTAVLVTEEGICLAATREALTGTDLTGTDLMNDRENSGPGLGRFLTGQALKITEEIADYSLTVIYRAPGSVVSGAALRTAWLMLAILFGATVLLIFFSSRLTRRMTRPMAEMMEKMELIAQGSFRERLHVQGEDEIAQLSEHFNDMARQLEAYTNEVYVSQIRQKEAELTALKSQIYPHFLYNTLEVIRMTAVDEDDGKVAGMVEALSDQIRYLIGTAGDMVPLKQEVSMLEKYIFLINCRFGDKVVWSAQLGRLSEITIPKLILQPLVENAFKHGVRGLQGQGQISLTAEKTEEADILLTVMDNGKGMTQEELAGIRELLDGDDPGRKTEFGWESIGLKNVHDRVRFLYGPAYGLRVWSKPGMGTAVSVRIPRDPAKTAREEHHVYDDPGR